MQKKAFTGQFVAAGELLNVGIAPAWAADPAGSGSSAANRLPAQVAQAASDQPPPAPGEQPAAAEEQPAAPTAMTTPTMVGPLAANPNPMSFDAGPLGPVYVTGAVGALGLWQNNKFPGDQNSLLPTLVGAEYTFSFENMNIERGLLWNQENAVNRGVQLNYAADPFTFAFSWNDGF